MIIDIEDKIKQTLTKLEKPYVVQDVFNMFIQLFPQDWKKHKIAYSKFNRSKQFGRSIPLAKPEVSLKRMIQASLYKQQNN